MPHLLLPLHDGHSRRNILLLELCLVHAVAACLPCSWFSDFLNVALAWMWSLPWMAGSELVNTSSFIRCVCAGQAVYGSSSSAQAQCL